LAKRHKVGVTRLVQPFSLLHVFVMKIAQMGGRPAEGSEAKFGGDRENLHDSAMFR
jgi:hypothetical protein